MTDRWEYCVIGTAIATPSTVSEAENDLLPSDFTGENVGVWAEILNLYHRDSLSARSLIEQLRSSGIANPERIVDDAIQYRGDTMKLFVDKVLESSTRRALVRNGALIAAEAGDTSMDVKDVLERAEKNIMSLRRNRSEGLSMADLVSVFIPRIRDIRNGNFQPAWEPELLAMKRKIMFLESQDFMVVAARPGEGKSSYLKYEAYHLAKRNKGVLIINLENAPIEYIRSFVALDTGIDSDKMKAANHLSDDELARVKASAEALSKLPIYIETAASVDEIAQKSRKYKADKNISLVMVDYIQLIYNPGFKNRVEDLTYTTGKLKALTRSVDIPLLAAAQLSREIEHRGANTEPQLSDLRDSGSIEQDATVVAFPRSIWSDPTPEDLRRFPENVDPHGHLLSDVKAIPIKFYVRKNRNGAIGETEPIKWTKSTNNFQTLVREHQQ